MSKGSYDELVALFRELDTDSSGTISAEELRAGFPPDYFARYARSVMVAFLTKGRFIAYTSDIGESARPIMPRWFVNGCCARTLLPAAVSGVRRVRWESMFAFRRAPTPRPPLPSLPLHRAACFADGLTFAYVGLSVGNHTYEAHASGLGQAMVARAFAHSATFELIASVALPSLVIHQEL